jgi:hypothetical protein
VSNRAVQVEKESFFLQVSPMLSSRYHYSTEPALSPHIYVDFGPHAGEISAL